MALVCNDCALLSMHRVLPRAEMSVGMSVGMCVDMRVNEWTEEQMYRAHVNLEPAMKATKDECDRTAMRAMQGVGAGGL